MEPFTILVAVGASFIGQVVRTVIKEYKESPERKLWDVFYSVITNKLFSKEEKQASLDNKISRLTTSLNEATSVIGQIESEINRRTDLAKKLSTHLEETKQELKTCGNKQRAVRSIDSACKRRVSKRRKSKFLERRWG
jgi:chromosome segregation ATPase